MKKVNFSTKNAKVFRMSANVEFKGFNSAVKAVLVVWERGTNDKELNASIESAKADGITANDFSAAYIIEHLNWSNFCKDGVIGVTSKGEFKAKASWTAGQVVDYVRRANRARILAENKAEKDSAKTAKASK